MGVGFGRGGAAAMVGAVVAGVLLGGCSSGSSSTSSVPSPTPASTPASAPASPATTVSTSGSSVSAPGPTIAPDDLPLRIADIRPAVAALETELGGPQHYFEINATPTLVNLFVATNNGTQAVAYVYAVGSLRDPATPQAASGPTFTADQLTFEEDTVLSNVVAQLPDSQLRGFSAVGNAQGAVSYVVTVDSARGGRLEIPVSGDGSILGVNES